MLKLQISIMLLVLVSVASADTTFSPVYAKGEMNQDASFRHCKDVDVRIRHESIIKNGNMRVTLGSGTMLLTLEQDGKDIVRRADEYDTGFGKWRFKADTGWFEMQIFVWPLSGPHREDKIYIGVMRIVDGQKCTESWHGEARRVR